MTEGPDFNEKLKSFELLGGGRIEHFKKSVAAPDASKRVVKIDGEESDYEIKLWYNSPDNTAYYFSEAETIYLNKDSSYMFFTRSDDTTIKNIQDIDVSNFNTSMVTDMSGLFMNKPNLTSLNLSNFDTSNVTNMRTMFSGLSSITSLNLSNFDTSKVEYMNSMFEGMTNLASLNISNFDTSKVKSMHEMFYKVTNLTSLNLSNFNTSNVIYMDYMFSNMTNLISLDLSNFNTSMVKDMSGMFHDMTNLTTLDLSNFDTSKVTDMNYMFYLYDEDKLKDKLEKIYVNNDFDTYKLRYSTDMFGNRKKLRGGNGSYLTNPSTANRTWLRVDRPGVQGYFTRKS